MNKQIVEQLVDQIKLLNNKTNSFFVRYVDNLLKSCSLDQLQLNILKKILQFHENDKVWITSYCEQDDSSKSTLSCQILHEINAPQIR